MAVARLSSSAQGGCGLVNRPFPLILNVIHDLSVYSLSSYYNFPFVFVFLFVR